MVNASIIKGWERQENVLTVRIVWMKEIDLADTGHSSAKRLSSRFKTNLLAVHPFAIASHYSSVV